MANIPEQFKDWENFAKESYCEGMNETAIKMFLIHTHADIANDSNPEQIVYLEKDVTALLESFGIPAPIWRKDDPYFEPTKPEIK